MPRFDDCTGMWRGTNGFRLMPSDALAERPASMTVTVAARASLTSLAYRWEHPEDGPQEGLLVVGPGDEADSLVALWGDSWHQQPAPMQMTGSATDDSVELDAEYAGGWGWRIVVRPAGSSSLTMRMENVIPSDQATADMSAGPYTAMLMDLRRS